MQLMFFFLFSFVLQHFILASSKPVYTPIETIFIDCGSNTSSEIYDRKWTADGSDYRIKVPSDTKSLMAKALDSDSFVEPVPYLTARISTSAFSYTFSLVAGPKFLRFHFYPATYMEARGSKPAFNRSKGLIEVQAGRYNLLSNFSAAQHSDAWGNPTFIKEFIVNVEENQELNVTFAPSTSDSYAFINAIEIVSMPFDLYYTFPGSGGLTIVGQDRKFNIENDIAFALTCRLNVGGNAISARDDTGMYRTWESDYIYFLTECIVDNQSFPNCYYTKYPDVSLIHSKVPNYTAPDDLYRSGASLGPNKTNNLLNNLTWLVNVDLGFKYMVRLHFCEIVYDQVRKVNDRSFLIYMANHTVETGFDIFKAAGGSRIPIYKDYIVSAPEVGNPEDGFDIFIVLHPNASSVADDAILNGIEIFRLSNSSGGLSGTNTPIPPPFAPPPAVIPIPPATVGKKYNTKKILLISIPVGVIGLALLLALLSFFVFGQMRRTKQYDSCRESLSSCCFWNPDKGKQPGKNDSSLPGELCRRFKLSEIKDATENFHEDLKIGVGGFGKVYKGSIDNGEKTVAVKRLQLRSSQGDREFKNEIEMLSRLRHFHLVSLIGYCNEGHERILVYDYMENGTLREHLYYSDNDPLPWKKRLDICIGAAKGLHYLHSSAGEIIIHRDVKTTNILLDGNHVAKVSDFGFSKTGLENTHITTKVKGTVGYVDPEYYKREQLTQKSDVYSFGVVLFEVLCARKAVDTDLEYEQQNLANWAKKCIQNGTIHEIMDPYLMGRIAPVCFNKFVEIAASCIRNQGTERPTMQDVVDQLVFALELQTRADDKVENKTPGVEQLYPWSSFKPSEYTNVVINGPDGGVPEDPESDSSDASVEFTSSDARTNTTFDTSRSYASTHAISGHVVSDAQV